MSSCARRHFARRPSAASGDDYIAGSLRSSPARSALSAFAVQLRPAFADLPDSGLYSHRPIHAACVSQRFARRLCGGPAVMHSARGAFAAFGIVLVCASSTTGNLRLLTPVLQVLQVLLGKSKVPFSKEGVRRSRRTDGERGPRKMPRSPQGPRKVPEARRSRGSRLKRRRRQLFGVCRGRHRSRCRRALEKIYNSKTIKTFSPSEENHILPCISFTECNICGLVNHSERYGRFGLVFKKDVIWKRGGRPVMYLDRKSYSFFGKEFRESTEEWKRNFFSLINLYSPPGSGKVQDYSHEREWRLFEDLDLTQNKPDAIICPTKYYSKITGLFQETIIIPLDLLEQWGL